MAYNHYKLSFFFLSIVITLFAIIIPNLYDSQYSNHDVKLVYPSNGYYDNNGDYDYHDDIDVDDDFDIDIHVISLNQQQYHESNIMDSIHDHKHHKQLVKRTLRVRMKRLFHRIKSVMNKTMNPFKRIVKNIMPLFRRVIIDPSSKSNPSPSPSPSPRQHSHGHIKSSKPLTAKQRDEQYRQYHYDLTRFDLSVQQKQMIDDALKSSILQDPTLITIAKSTNFHITPMTMYQYYDAVDWINNYHGKR